MAGIVAYAGSTVSGCSATQNGGDGIRVNTLCLVTQNAASLNGGTAPVAAGIRTIGSSNRIESNVCQSNIGTGILSGGGTGADVIVRNSCANNSVVNYNPNTGTTFGPLTTPSSATATAWANF